MTAANQSELKQFQCQWCKSAWADMSYTSRRRFCSYACEEQERAMFSLARRKDYGNRMGMDMREGDNYYD